ncbi:MAG: hypothetical protein J6D03_06595 [Clostridia bacterium]|nr:hypothetical protein [Clostridia bacterium]
MKIKYFEDNICKYCKAQCNKVIILEENKEIKTIRCNNYEKDESKIKGYVKPKERTVKFSRSIMGLYNPSWN